MPDQKPDAVVEDDAPEAPKVPVTFESVVAQAQALVPEEPNKLAFVVQRTWDAVNASDAPVYDVTTILADEAAQWDDDHSPAAVAGTGEVKA